MTSVGKDHGDISISHYFAPDSPYNVPPTPSKTSARVQTRMYDIKAVSRYYGINHPILSPSKKRLIEQKLSLDEKVRVELDNRMKDDNLFAKFHRNPFSMKEKYAPSAYQLLEEEQRKKRRGKGKGGNERQFMQTTKDTLVRATNELKENDFIRGQTKLTLARSYNKISSQILKNASDSVLRSSSPLSKPKRADESAKAMGLDDILRMEDQNFFAARLQNLNIFQIMRGTHKPFLTRDTLDKLHFNFTHLVERIDVVKFPLLRDLYRVGRDLMQERTACRHNRIDFINSSEMAVNYGDVRMGDLLSMASGRFDPEIAYAAANQGDVRKDFSPTSSLVSEGEILYDSRMRHKQHNCQNPMQQRYEIEAYHMIEDNAEEIKIDRFCARITNNITSDMQLRRHLLKNTIQDKAMHGKIQAAVQENISYLANLTNKRKTTTTPERIISQNKINKNRKETLQIRHLLQSIQLKNREEEKIKQLLNPH